MKPHPAVLLYRELFAKATDGTSVPTMPDPVRRTPFHAECKRRGISIPENFIDLLEWEQEIGLRAEAGKLQRQWRRRIKTAQNKSPLV